MTALALSLAYAGFAGICLAMQRHRRQVWGRDAGTTTQTGCRMAGWLFLALSLVPCFVAWGWAPGLLAWFGVLTTAGVLLTFLLPYAPRGAAALGVVAPIVAVAALLAGGP